MSMLPATLLLALAAATATAQTPKPTPAPATVEAPAPGTAPAPAAAAAPAAGTEDVPIPEKIPSPASEEAAPTVTIHSVDNGDVVEEYRQGGRIFMVRVTPLHGKPYYLYDDDRNGRLDRTDADRASVSPVYWTIYEWD